jgi:multidrug efflux pump subunit AcrB
MRIWFDVQRLNNLNMAPSEIINVINAQNVQAPVGRIGARPVSDDQQFQFNVQTEEGGDDGGDCRAGRCEHQLALPLLS